MRINQSIWSRTSIAVLILSFVLATTPRTNAEDRGNSNRDAAELFAVLPRRVRCWSLNLAADKCSVSILLPALLPFS